MKKLLRILARALPAAFVLLVVAVVWGSFYLVSFALTPAKTVAAKYATSWRDVCAESPLMRDWIYDMRQSGTLCDTLITNPQGVRLHALYAAAPVPTDRTAVIVHGYTDCAQLMLMIGYLYHHDLGFNILLPDLQYHGASGGEAIRMGWHDRHDLLLWMEVADTLFGGDTQMVVHGISMGAATVMMASGEEQKPYVKCFVEDCGYTDVREQFAKELRERFHLPAFPVLDLADRICRWKYGWSFREASSLKQVRRCTLPMLFIHGDADRYVPTRMVYPLYEAKPGEKELWVVPDATHAMSYRNDPVEYTRHVAEFVGRYISGIPTAAEARR